MVSCVEYRDLRSRLLIIQLILCFTLFVSALRDFGLSGVGISLVIMALSVMLALEALAGFLTTKCEEKT